MAHVVSAEQLDESAFRQVLGHYATGVVVIAAQVEGTRYGMAVNSFVSVSLQPRLVSFCAAHTSTTWPHLRRSDGFAVSILASTHEDVCRLFATRDADRYTDDSGWTTTPAGHPVLADALAWLDCVTVSVQPAGDHDVVLGEVLAAGIGDGEPLVFFRGAFTALAR